MICARCEQDAGEGSRGPATGYMRPLCPSCGDIVDGELETLVRRSVEMQAVFDNLFPSVVQEFGLIA